MLLPYGVILAGVICRTSLLAYVERIRRADGRRVCVASPCIMHVRSKNHHKANIPLANGLARMQVRRPGGLAGDT